MPEAVGRLLNFAAGPTVSRYIASTRMYNVIQSPRGEGKTTGSSIAVSYHSSRISREYWPVRWAVLRDTRVNLGLTVVKTLKEWYPPGFGSEWTGKRDVPDSCLIFQGKPREACAELHFFGCDNPDDLSKFLSLELGALWLVEPAPAATVSGGIDAGVLAVGVSSLRQNPFPRVQIEGNPPDPAHWTVKLWPELADDPTSVVGETPPEMDQFLARVRHQSAVFKIPRGENKALDIKRPGYREDMEAMFMAMQRPDLVARLSYGRVGDVQMGLAVTPEYSPEHEAPALQARVRESLLFAWDAWHHPACVIFRVVPGGHCDVLAAFLGANVGMQQFLDYDVLPWCRLHLPERVTYQHVIDPSATTGDASDKRMSAALAIRASLPGPMKEATAAQDDRRNPAHDVLMRPGPMGRGKWCRLDTRFCQPLMKALGGGWHYATRDAAQTVGRSWVKNLDANVGEAFGYGCWYLTCIEEGTSTLRQWQQKYALHVRAARQASASGGTGV